MLTQHPQPPLSPSPDAQAGKLKPKFGDFVMTKSGQMGRVAGFKVEKGREVVVIVAPAKSMFSCAAGDISKIVSAESGD